MKTTILIILLIIVPIFYSGSNASLLSKMELRPTVEVVAVEPATVVELSIEEIKEAKEDTIRTTLLDLGVAPFHTELIVAQSKFESGMYSNNLSKYNNVFGRHYHKSDTLSTGGGAEAEGHNRFAKYPSIKAATLSQYQYLKKMNYSFSWKSSWQYAYELRKKHYYTAPLSTYASGLLKLSKWDAKTQSYKQ
jgi:hypothetical protein